MIVCHGPRKGTVTPPPSKSHLHRLLIADFLSGEMGRVDDSKEDSDDILATKRCLRALANDSEDPVLDCGESGTTLRFIRPVAAALGKKPKFVMHGRLASRPDIIYDTISSGVHELSGDVSSQFASGLLFALPLLHGDSEIRFTSPPESVGYINLTVSVIEQYGITVRRTVARYLIPGEQCYKRPVANTVPETDWSAAAVWLAMNALGSRINVNGLNYNSLQPDKAIVDLLNTNSDAIDVSQCPDLFPILSVVAARGKGCTFTGTKRLHYKESDRISSTTEMLSNLGVSSNEQNGTFTVSGRNAPFESASIHTFGDHRIAMAAALAATASKGDITINDSSCISKSYPSFFNQFESLRPY